MPGVVRADHQHDALRLVAVELPVLAAPDQVLRLISRIADVEDAVRLSEFGKRFPALALPVVRDRIAEEDQIDLALRIGDFVAVPEQAVKPPVPCTVTLVADARHRILGDRLRRAELPLADKRRIAVRRFRKFPFRERIVNVGFDGREPDLIAERVRMEEIREDLGRKFTVRRQELVVEVTPEDALSVRKLRDLLVHDLVATAISVVRVLAARKDRGENDRGLRLFLGDDVQDLPDAENCIGRRLLFDREVSGVVRADHQQDALRLVAVEFLAFRQTPNDMLGAIGTGAEVKHLPITLGEILRLLGLAVCLPEVSDRVADENDLRAPVGDDAHLLVVPLHLPVLRIPAPRIGRNGADIGKARQRSKGRACGDKEFSSVHFFSSLMSSSGTRSIAQWIPFLKSKGSATVLLDNPVLSHAAHYSIFRN